MTTSEQGAAPSGTIGGASNGGGAGGPSAAAPALPAIAHPKGGGAVRGIGEKFDVAAATGGGVATVPLASTPGRGGFGPDLTLAYDSGRGNGPFGLGWDLALPAVRRKTDKGLPRYRDGEEADTFVLSDAEDLVPVLDGAGERVVTPRRVHEVDFDVHPYVPRVEGRFARIERWVRTDDGTAHWRALGGDGTTTLYGADPESRIADPADPRRIFAWLISRTFDDRGNLMVFGYAAEDGAGVDTTRPHEANRTAAARATQRYPKRIRYGNATPYLPTWEAEAPPPADPAAWHFEVVFDHGEHDPDAPLPAPDRPWAVRPDPFSTYRAGFEVRTYRRCERVLVFHHFPGEPEVGEDCLVRATELRYSDEAAPADPRNPSYTLLAQVVQRGFRRDGAGGYLSRVLPPLELEYTAPELSQAVRTLDGASAANLPQGLDGARFRHVDLDGDALPGVLTDAGDGWAYKPNLGPLAGEAAFGALRPVGDGGAPRAARGAVQLLDLAADGQLDAVTFEGGPPGFYERTLDGGWEPFRPFATVPRLGWSDPGTRFADLTGDGHADVLVADGDLLRFHPSLGEAGFGEAETVRLPPDEESGPRVDLADATGSLALADMTGDGLVDLVRIRDGEVCYWPSLGFGRFGAKVTMDAAPRLAPAGTFDPRRVRLADIDGTGTTDLLYAGEEGVVVCFNRSGNGWAEPVHVAAFPSADADAAVEVLDLLGTGTACLVWSSPLPRDAGGPLRYVDLMAGGKPHLLVRTRNGLGSETTVTYTPSTVFALRDRQAGRPWATRLPMPVHVVERVEIRDRVAGTCFVKRFAYHHGHFDGHEREFRGFGMVETWDTAALGEVEGENWDAASWSPPVRTRTWYHTGAFLGAETLERRFAAEYWAEPAHRAPARAAALLPDTVLDPAIGPHERREALRALKGVVLRQEVYADDGSPRAADPYTVQERSYAVTRVQPAGSNRHAVFRTHAREQLACDFERTDDPRVRHDVVLEVDGFGNVLRKVAIGYPRRPGPAPDAGLAPALAQMLAHDQARLHVAATASSYTDPLTDPAVYPDAHRLPLPAETVVAELTGLTPPAGPADTTPRFTVEALDAAWAQAWTGAHDVPYEEIVGADVDGVAAAPPPATGLRRRVIEHTRTRYRPDDLDGLLPLGTAEPLAIAGRSYHLALTLGLLERVLGGRVAEAELPAAGYVQLPGHDGWWNPGDEVRLSPGDADTPAQELAAARAHFFVPRRAIDAHGGVHRVAYDGYDLLVAGTEDPVGNTSQALGDYRVLLPWRTVDANGSREEAAFDALGMVVATAVAGDEGEGDTLAGLAADLSAADVAAFLADPLGAAPALLAGATTRLVYDVGAYDRTRDDAQPQPCCVATLQRETHAADDPDGTTRIDVTLAYADGSGGEIQSKVLAAPGPVPGAGPGGGAVHADPRWLSTGWTVLDNKDRPVRTYEPFFTAAHGYEPAQLEGESTVAFHDALDRLIATLHPDGTWEKSVFDAWRTETWDAGDTVLIADPRADGDVGDHFARLLGDGPGAYTSWHARRIGGTHGATPAERQAEQDAAQKAALHAGTPVVAHLDVSGSAAVTVSDAGAGRRLAGRVAGDAEGRPLAVIDALGRQVAVHVVREPLPGGGGATRYLAGYDLAGAQLYRGSMDAGERHAIADATGRPWLAWDALGRRTRTVFDAAGRPTHRWVREDDDADERLAERMVYGETAPADRRLRGRLWRQYDGAGLTVSERYDFKGNLLEASRTFAAPYRGALDWAPVAPVLDADALDAAAAPLLDLAERYVSTTAFDAVDRPVQAVAPHRAGMRPSVLQPVYDVGGELVGTDVWIRHPAAPAALLDPATADVHAVTGVERDAAGLRTRIVLGNGTETTYAYDPLTDRLRRVVTDRGGAHPAGERIVQDLRYAYDPAGNVTRIRDEADTQNAVFFRNQRVDPTMDLTYDALYRLTRATGREHLGQGGGGGGGLNAPSPHGPNDTGRTGIAHPGDGNALATYVETYAYDDAGNLDEVAHHAGGGGWTRRYAYDAPSLLEPGRQSNRLTATSLPGDPAGGPFGATYAHDAHGNMTAMPHLPLMVWDEQDRLVATARQVVASGTPETTHHRYDAGGVRLRKVTDRQAADGETPRRRTERLYLGPIELYREFAGDGVTVTLERETLHIAFEGSAVARIETRTAGTDPGPAELVRYQHTNHQGSATLELDAAGAIISYEELTPYGSTSYQAVRSQTETPKRYRWSGRERDEESGLYHHGARYFAPWLGRWTSADPIGTGDGANVFAYARGNPIRLSDPSGTQSAPGEESFASLDDTVAELNADEAVKKKLTDTRKHAKPAAKPMSKKGARQYGNQQAAKYRKQAGMKGGAKVQAGHTAAARHASESKISKADWDRQQMQQLHSRRGKGLDATVTDQAGQKKTTSRHRSQEGLIDESVERARKANGGKLTPQGQLDAADEVRWKTSNVPMDQRDVDAVRKGGAAKPDPGPPMKDGAVIPGAEADAAKARGKAALSDAAKVKSEAKAVATEAKVASKATKATSTAAKATKGAKVMAKLGKAGRHALAAIPIAGAVIGHASAAHAASQGDYTSAALDEAGFIPVAGDLLDAGRAGIALGEALDEGLGISTIAAEHGMAIQDAAKGLGMGETASFVVGAVGTVASSWTVAPVMAAGQAISGLFD